MFKVFRPALFLSFLLANALLVGCMMSPVQFDPAQLAMQKQMMQQMMQQKPQVAQQQVVTPKVEPQISEEELSNKLEKFEPLEQQVTIIRKKDGFDVNGMRFVDPEGKIVSYGYDVTTGDITYLAKNGLDTYVIKFTRAISDFEPVTIATAEREGPRWTVMTVTGKKLFGESLTPLAKGFLVSRETSGFIYEPGKKVTSFGAPDGFHVASFQNGEIQKTRYVLLERDAIDESNQLGGLLSSAKSLGSSLGINKKEDYLLLNFKTGQQIPINIDIEGKSIAIHSKCRKTNSFVNECEQVDFYESLFDKYGMPNGSHYFWSISWFDSDKGPILITKEGTKVMINNLETGKVATAYKRIMGINYIQAERTCDGNICLKAKLGFKKEQIDDVETFLETALSQLDSDQG